MGGACHPLAVLSGSLVFALFWPYSPRPVTGEAAASDELVPDADMAASSAATNRAAGLENSTQASEVTVIEAPVQYSTAATLFEPPTGNAVAPQHRGSTDAESVILPPREDLDPQTAELRGYLAEALQLRETGEEEAAAESLRNAIILATKIGNRQLHAAARLELGDIAQVQGDLHTACEHWQMARSLYEEEQSDRDAKRCESRMMSNGCPTDWVLTDF